MLLFPGRKLTKQSSDCEGAIKRLNPRPDAPERRTPVNLIQATKSVMMQYATFTGTSRRSELWWWALTSYLVTIALAAFAYRLSDSPPPLAAIWGLAVLVPTLAVVVRRLRDAGHAWQHTFWLLLPIAGLVVVGILCLQPSRTIESPVPREGLSHRLSI